GPKLRMGRFTGGTEFWHPTRVTDFAPHTRRQREMTPILAPFRPSRTSELRDSHPATRPVKEYGRDRRALCAAITLKSFSEHSESRRPRCRCQTASRHTTGLWHQAGHVPRSASSVRASL